MSQSAPAPTVVEMDTAAPPAAPPRKLGVALTVVLVTTCAFVWLVWFAEPNLARLFSVIMMPAVGGFPLLCWWLFLSGHSWKTKMIPLLIAVIGAALALALAHQFARVFAIVWGIPASAGVAVLYASVARSLNPNAKLRGTIATLLAALAFVPWFAVQTAGQQGEGMISFSGRWQTPHVAVLRERSTHGGAASAPADLAALSREDWTGFRGPQRDGAYRGETRLDAAAFASPRELWRKPVGPAWSSFAVVGDVAWTQEQQGDQECVTCFDLRDGNVIWSTCIANRFDEMAGGPGPRSTPTFADGRLYVMGPSAHLLCLDAGTGKLIWRYDHYAASLKPPMWGFACSPLMHEGRMIIGLCGAGGIRLAAHDAETGSVLWIARGGADGYSSPQLAKLAGATQIVYFDGAGCVSVDPATGAVLWDFPWPAQQPRAAQPAILNDSELVIGMGYGVGLKKLAVAAAAAETREWQVRELWSSNKLKPKFNDFVRFGDHLYGLDENILTCVSSKDGSRMWKGGRYGFGQVLLAPPHLVVVSETGEVALVEATPAEHRELARFKALDGKTWNHPVVTGTKLLVRNGTEAACFYLGGSGQRSRS